MGKNKTKLEQIQRELDKRAPAEPLRIQVYWADWRDPNDEGELAYEVVVDGERHRTIDLKWPEELDDERMARQVAPGRA